MSVPTWKRKIDEGLKVLTFANEIRIKTDELMFRKFWVKNANDVIRKRYKPKIDENTTYDEYIWFFEKEQRILSTLFANLQINITAANSINPFYKSEFLMRRNYHDRTICNIWQIKKELNYIVTVINVNVNKYTEIVSMLDEELRMLKSWKKSMNKFKNKMIE